MKNNNDNYGGQGKLWEKRSLELLCIINIIINIFIVIFKFERYFYFLHTILFFFHRTFMFYLWGMRL